MSVTEETVEFWGQRSSALGACLLATLSKTETEETTMPDEGAVIGE